MAAHEKLSERQELFVRAYVKTGNATESASEAGYSAPEVAGCRLLRYAKISDEIVKRSAEIVKFSAEKVADAQIRDIADAAERREFWSKVMRGEFGDEAEMRDRLKAAELLGKASGDFIERREITSPDGSLRPITIQVVGVGSRAGPDT